MSDKIIIDICNLTKAYKLAKNKVFTANSDINFSIKRGETFGIAGESGSGKSTLAKILVNMEKPTSGDVIFDGVSLKKLNKKQLKDSRKKIQMVFQDSLASFHPKMNCLEILSEPLVNYSFGNKDEIKKRAEILFEQVGLLKDYLYKYPKNMSGGQRQRLGIARALALEPEVLVCDEITSALDVISQKRVIELLVGLQKKMGLTIVFISHNIALVQQIAHRAAIMKNGKVIEILEGNWIEKRGGLAPYTQKLIEASEFIEAI